MSKGGTVRCGACDRVLLAPGRTRTVPRAERQHWDERTADDAWIDRAEQAHQLLGEPAGMKDKGKVRAGVVTFPCRCGVGYSYPFDEFLPQWLAAKKEGRELVLVRRGQSCTIGVS